MVASAPPPDPKRLARRARLRYVSDSEPGFVRRRCGKGFAYIDEQRERLADEAHRARIAALAIPPAWEKVWICPFPTGHLQATGRDARGRKQYLYHERWTRMSNWVKFDQLRAFGKELPAIRRKVRRDLRSTDDQTRTLALMVVLLDKTAIRVGNREYARENNHYGLTTLLDEHVTVRGDVVRFEFAGKSGKERIVELKDRSVATRIRKLLGRKGHRLFETPGTNGSFIPLEAEHVNDYLRDLMPAGCTAKTFRTWHGTVAAFEALAEACGSEPAGQVASETNGQASKAARAIEKTLRDSVKAAATLLGNTTAVCKAYYVHPALCDLYSAGALANDLRRLRPKPRPRMSPAEVRLLALLDRIEQQRA